MEKVAFYTLGCKLNFSETSSIVRIFEQHGYKRVGFNDKPDIYVINTCSVTDNADKKCRRIVKEAQKNADNPYIIVIGCYAQLKPQEIADIPGVDAVLGTSEKFRLLELLDGFEKHPKPRVLTTPVRDISNFDNSFSINDRTRTFLKIQDGCDYSCSFCTIPLARGKSRSNTIENVLVSAKEIADNDVKEIVLTGVNTGDFGIINGKREERFFDLLTRLNAIEKIERYRISSIEPNLLTDEIIDFVADSEKFVPHFHIPLQSGSDKILRLMRRRYKRELYEEKVRKIRSVMPDACIGVDVIVGFPGETEEDFKDSWHFINGMDISYLHVFTYSERENTDALKMDGIVPKNVRAERSSMLRTLSEKKHRYFNEKFENTIRKVLFEKDIENGKIHGFTDNYIRVAVDMDKSLINTLLTVKLLKLNPYGVMEGQVL